jgi:DNA-binding NtrC family response regulator
MPVIMMSGHATIDTAAEASRIGASDFLEKPITLQKLLRAVQNGLTRPAQKPAGVPAPAAGTPAAAALAPRDTGPVGVMPVAAAGAVEPPAPFGEPVAAPVAVTPAVPDSPAARLLLRELPLDAPLRDARDAFERAYFEHHLMREQGSMTRVAERTGLERTHLYRKLKQLGIDLSRGVWRKPPSN